MNWKSIKLFNELYEKGETSKELLNIPLAKRIMEMEYITPSSKNLIQKTPLFDDFYLECLQHKFYQYTTLLNKYQLQDTNFNEKELVALCSIELNKEAIINEGKSVKEISTLYFDDAKYLKKGVKLFEAVLKVLEVDILPVDEHDQQFLHILHCKNKVPNIVILCENDNQLRKPRLDDVELWFAGGRNTAKLKFIPEPTVPLYYLCDWDNRGIEIFQDIKKHIFPSIQILLPQEPFRFLKVKSSWKTKLEYSFYSEEAISLLNKLVPNYWIEEESISHSYLSR